MEIEDRKTNFSRYASRRENNRQIDAKVESIDNYLRIWQANPSHKDIRPQISRIKAIFLVSLITFFMMGTYLITSNLFIATGISLLTLIFFILIFHDNSFCLKEFFSFHLRKQWDEESGNN